MSAARTGCGAGGACTWALQGGDGPDPAAGGHGGLLPANGRLRVVASGSDDLYQHRLAAGPSPARAGFVRFPGNGLVRSPGPVRGFAPGPVPDRDVAFIHADLAGPKFWRGRH